MTGQLRTGALVSDTFARPCTLCGSTVLTVHGRERSHDCSPSDTHAGGLAHAWWAGWNHAASLRSLTFADLQAANLSRCQRWHPGFPDDENWTGADWSNAIGGEAGELAEAALAVVAAVGKLQNTIKKIRRYETGTNTEHDKPLDVLWAEFDAEMADVACYLDLLATKYGRDLAGAIVAKFNAVSERQGFPERLGESE